MTSRGPHGHAPVRDRRGPGRALLVGLAAIVLAGCGERGCGPVVATYHLSSADSLRHPTQTFELRASKRRTENRPPKGQPPPPPGGGQTMKVHPLIAQLVQTAQPGAIDSFLVTFVDTVGPAVRTLGLSKVDLQDHLILRRTPLYDSLAIRLDAMYEAQPISDFWLIHAVFLRMPVRLVDSLAKRNDVIRIEPMLGDPPPQELYGVCGGAMYDMAFLRTHIGSDGYADAGYGPGIIALFDTGVNPQHDLLKGSERVTVFYECTPEGCEPRETQEDLKPPGHGTASAAILTGESDAWPGQEGVTRATLHSYSVYSVNDTGGLQVNLPAAAHAIALAALGQATVLVAEIATTSGGPGALSMSVGEAFEYDQAVVVANGNNGTSLYSPADATHALGVGAYCPISDLYVNEYVHGATGDGRWKPDLTAPTSLHTARKSPNNAMGVYEGTSGATPVVAGAALLLGNRMANGSGAVRPGNLYAALLLAAETDAHQITGSEGAGRVRLPQDGALYWGSFDVKQSEAWEIPIEIETDGDVQIEALIWWPQPGDTPYAETGAALQSDIDLALLDPSGNAVAESASWHEVRERVTGDVPPGSAGKWWTVELYGYGVPAELQEVYWAVWVRSAAD